MRSFTSCCWCMSFQNKIPVCGWCERREAFTQWVATTAFTGFTGLTGKYILMINNEATVLSREARRRTLPPQPESRSGSVYFTATKTDTQRPIVSDIQSIIDEVHLMGGISSFPLLRICRPSFIQRTQTGVHFDQNAAFKWGFLIGSEYLMCPIPPKMCLADVWGERSEQTRCHQTHRIIRHFDRWTGGAWQSVIFHNQSARSAADSPNFLFNYFPQDKQMRQKKKKKQLKLSLCFSLSESITDQLINN